MAHLQYLPGDPRLVDQLVYELKSKGIFDQFRKDCIADVDTRPAYQNLRQRVENSVSTFLSRQCWQPDLNKNQLREKLRKHILDGNYLEQGVERIVDQVVNPKVAAVFIPQVEDLVYNYLGITRKKAVNNAETSNGKVEPLLPTDLEAVSPGSVKSNEDKNEAMEVENIVQVTNNETMEVEEKDKLKPEVQDEEPATVSEANHNDKEKTEAQEAESGVSELTSPESSSIDKSYIPLPSEEIKLENIPPPDNSPPKEMELEKIELPKEINDSVNIPLPDETLKEDKDNYFKAINSDDDDSSSDSSLRRNMSPLTPIRNFNNENSCDAQQGFDNDSLDGKNDDKKEPSSFRFTIEATENCTDGAKAPKKPTDQHNLVYQFNNQVNISTFNTPMYEDSSNSNLLHIDYESDANSKVNLEQKPAETEPSEDSKKERKSEDKRSSHKSSHRSRDSHKHSSSKDRRFDSKHSTSRDGSRQDKKSKDENSKLKSNYKDSSRDKNDKKENKESSRHSSHKSSSHKDSKSYKSSSSSQRHSGKSSDEKRSSSHRDKSDRGSDKSSKDKPRDSKSSSRSDKDRKSSSKSKHDEKDKEKKEKKEPDDHYSVSGRGNPNRRSTDRDSNDGSSSSKGSHNQSSAKSSESKKDVKSGSSKSDNMSTSSGEGRSPNDRELTLQEKEKEVIDMLQPKPIVRLESHLETPIASPPRLPFVPDVQLKKPKFAANLEEAKKLMKRRKFLDEEQKRMNQDAALLLEFQANVRPSLSQIYSSIPGPELEFACVTNTILHTEQIVLQNNDGGHENTTTFITDQSNYAEDEGFSDHIDDGVPSTLMVKEVEESIESINEELNNKAKAHASEDTISKESYVSTLVENTTQPDYSDENVVNPDKIESKDGMGYKNTDNPYQSKENASVIDSKETAYFEVTVIAEEVTDDEAPPCQAKTLNNNKKTTESEENVHSEQCNFHYFAETEKYNAEVERDKFSKFLKAYTAKANTNKIYLINCDTYEESLVQEVLETFGQYEIVNYQRNGHLKLPKISKSIVKNVNLSNEVSLPEASSESENMKPITESVFSPVKSECSFELSSDYDAKLEEMVNKTSRQEIMEIILGNIIADSPTKMPKIDYLTDSNFESESENNLKRKQSEVETVNNNRPVLTPNKMRRLSTPDQISSTTEDIEERSNNNLPQPTRSKFLGRARRVGLPRPRNNLSNSPSSDKSVENYEQNTPETPTHPNGKIKTTTRSKVQRYDTSDLYKPKLHYLSRRNNIS